ncbi:MAG TPA: hypothetical protein VHS30_06605 [Streptosporangiaceae bacterium]|nr:hypothetical protein [Streptosporangiaceae bacterium]
MASPLDYAPIAAACFAVPEFVPQLRKLAVTGDAAGVSWSWGVLTAVNNAAWLAYFALSAYWTALIPSASATILATTLAVMLTRRGQARRRPAIAIVAWAALLTGAFAVAGRAGLGTLLTAAFTLQVAPSIWTAYRTARPSGIATGTWLLTLGELTCWLAFGLHKSDPRLIILGGGGIICCALILARVRRRRGSDRVRTWRDFGARAPVEMAHTSSTPPCPTSRPTSRSRVRRPPLSGAIGAALPTSAFWWSTRRPPPRRQPHTAQWLRKHLRRGNRERGNPDR